MMFVHVAFAGVVYSLV